MINVTPIRSAQARVEDDRFLSPAQVVEMVPGLSVRTLREWRAGNRGGLPWIQLSEKRVAYLESDVRAWALSRRMQPKDRP